MHTHPVLTASNLGCVRHGKLLFSNISFSLRAGETLYIAGNNGAGKSSLMRLLAGIATPAMGEINWQHASNYRSDVHYLAHENGLKLGLTVFENLKLAYCLQHSDIFIQKQDILAELTQLQIHTYLDTPIKQLSAGQQRKVALAKIFLIPKPVWILDEPLTALDQSAQNYVLNQIKTHVQQDGMAIISSHQAFSLDVEGLQTIRLNQC